MEKKHPALKNLALLFFLFFAFNAFSQISGDFRSKAIGPSDWNSAASWQTYVGGAWVDGATYPGQNTGTYTVTILTGHTISIVTDLGSVPMGSVIVNGTLILKAPGAPHFTVKLETMSLTISGTGSLIKFDGVNISLFLPDGASIEILSGGNIMVVPTCNNNIRIVIGLEQLGDPQSNNQQFAVCNGFGLSDFITFAQLVAAGGTINANITVPIKNITCGMESTTLHGNYTGVHNPDQVIYEWKVKDPNNGEVVISNTFMSDVTSSSFTFTPSSPLISGDYLVSFKVTTTLSSTSFSSTATKSITVKAFPVAPTSVSATTICEGNNTILSYAGGSGEIFNWYKSSCGGVLVGTGNNLSVSPTTTTTYYGRWENYCGISSCETVTVYPLPTVPATTNASICRGYSATLAASGAITGQTYKWYSLEIGGTLLKTGNDNADNTYGTLVITATTDYWVSIVNLNGCESIRTKATAFVNVNNRWNGSLSTNWNNAANWCIGVPSITNNLAVLIPSALSTTFSPTLSTGLYGYVENILFESGSILTVEGNYLFVKTSLTLNGKIDLNNESQLVQDEGSAFDALSTGSIEIDQQGEGNSFRYNYWSSPVNSRGTKFTIDEVLRSGDGTGTVINKNITYGAPYAWAEGDVDSSPIRLSTYWMYVLRNSGSGYSAWFRVGNTKEVLVGEGYTMKGSNTSSALQNYTFAGKPNNGNITLQLNAGFEYLVGNPYPSTINAANFLLDNPSTTGEIYFWEHYGGDTHNLGGYQAGYATRNLLDGVPATSAVGVSSIVASNVIKKIPGPYIAVGQAFFVVGGAVGGQINFKNSQREFVEKSSGNSIFMKINNSKLKTANNPGDDLRPKFRIGFDAPKISHRQLLLGIDERATKGIDWGFDAEIFEIFADDIYWMLDGKKYVIQGTNAVGLNSEVPLGIQLSKTGVVTVKIDALENVDDDTSVYLKDKLTGESFNMKDKPVQLNLTSGKYTDRFVLIFKTQKLVTEDVKAEILIPAESQPVIEGIHVFMNNAIKELQIKNNSDEEILSIELYNYLGQTVKTWNSNFKIRTISLPVNIATGVYLVQINTKTGSEVQKVVVE